MKEKDFYDAVWERLVALKSYKLISRGKSFRLTKRGFEFLKHEDKEYYLGKILIGDKYKRSKYPDVFLEVLKVYTSLNPTKRRSIKKVVLRGRLYDWGDLDEVDFERWSEFVDRIHKKFPNIPKEVISRVCDYSLRGVTLGVKSPLEIPVRKIKKIISELEEIHSPTTKVEESKSLVVDNLLELHLEDLIRRNINKLFPDFEIIDSNQHYYTKDGNYIDILCKCKSDSSIVVIELKRDRSTSRALIQLLDYMNQIMAEFNTKKVRGILVCRKIDKRAKSALETIRKKLKNPDDIKVLEFDLKFIAKYV